MFVKLLVGFSAEIFRPTYLLQFFDQFKNIEKHFAEEIRI